MNAIRVGTCLLLCTSPVLGGGQGLGLGTRRIASGLATPTSLAAPPGDTRLFVTTSPGQIWILKDGARLPQPFLDLGAQIDATPEGLLGLAFSPDYAQSGRFYVAFLDANDDSKVVEYRASSDPDRADPGSARVILGPLPQPTGDHNVACLQFGPDGMLWIGSGDGGPAYDPNHRAQDLGQLFGKLLRLDPLAPPPHVPGDNPFVGVPGARGEIWAYGLRQPWRFSFDRGTGDLYLADVGEQDREELNYAAAGGGAGRNYGWRCLEGTHCTQLPQCTCGGFGETPPLYEYAHLGGNCSITGGFVYRGEAIPWLKGRYLFADFCTGRIWSLRVQAGSPTDLREHTGDLVAIDGHRLDFPTSFGEGADGELYLLDNGGGEVFRLLPRGCTETRYCSSRPNSTGRTARMASSGAPSLRDDDYRLLVGGAVPGQLGWFFFGPRATRAPFGDGFLCVGGDLARLAPPLVIDSAGSASRALDFGAQGRPEERIHAGSTWYFQFLYRDPTRSGGSGFNSSDGWAVVFCP